MARVPISITAYSTPAITLTNPISASELQQLGQPIINVDATAEVEGVVGQTNGYRVTFDLDEANTGADNRTALLAAYTAAKALTGLSATNRATLVVPAGFYGTGTALTLDTEFVDLAGETGSPENVLIDSAIVVSAGNINISGIWGLKSLNDTSGVATNTFRDCIFGKGGDQATPASAVLRGSFLHCKFNQVGRASTIATFSGILDRCELFGGNAVYLAAGAVVRRCVATVTLNAAAGSTAVQVYLCALKAALGSNLVNDIATPYNVVDADIVK